MIFMSANLSAQIKSTQAKHGVWEPWETDYGGDIKLTGNLKAKEISTIYVYDNDRGMKLYINIHDLKKDEGNWYYSTSFTYNVDIVNSYSYDSKYNYKPYKIGINMKKRTLSVNIHYSGHSLGYGPYRGY